MALQFGQTVGPEVIFAPDPFGHVPRVTPLADGSFILAWQSDTGDLVAKHLNSAGSFTTGDFLLGVSTFAAAQNWALTTPLIVQRQDGSITTDFGVLNTPTHDEIGIHTVDAAFDDTSFPFIIPRASSAGETLIDAVPTFSGTAVAYEQGAAGNLTHTFLRWYNADGTSLPADNQLGNPGESGSQMNVKILSLVNTVDAVYAHVNPDGSSDVRFEELTPNGINSNAIGVSGTGTPFANFPDMTRLPDGSLVVVWQDQDGVMIKHMLSNGIVLGTTRAPNSAGAFLPKVAALKDGSFVLAWTAGSGTEHDGSPNEDLFLQHFGFNAQGSIVPSSSLIHLAEPGDQGLFEMSMKTLTDGRVVLAYATETGDATNVTNLAYRFLDFSSPLLNGNLGNVVAVQSDGSIISDSGSVGSGLGAVQLGSVLSAASVSMAQLSKGLGGAPAMSFAASAAMATPDNGSAGSHAFVISALPSDASNAPHWTDFNPATDTVLLSHQAFAELAQGPLPIDAFFAGPTAHDATDRIMYDATTGALSYDSDGNGPSGATVLAMAQPGLAVHAGNFVVG
jgi:hypothetical protein